MTIQFLASARKQFATYKALGEKSLACMTDEQLHWSSGEDSNGAAVIVRHMSGNMLSRWTDFLTTDGEKPWRKRDEEFVDDNASRAVVMQRWEDGWQCLFDALAIITDYDLGKVISIRGEQHTILDAVNRQLAHYSYHVGQIVLLAKMCNNGSWQSLSIPRNGSDAYNVAMMGANLQGGSKS
jgi:hypothetical protein